MKCKIVIEQSTKPVEQSIDWKEFGDAFIKASIPAMLSRRLLMSDLSHCDCGCGGDKEIHIKTVDQLNELYTLMGGRYYHKPPRYHYHIGSPDICLDSECCKTCDCRHCDDVREWRNKLTSCICGWAGIQSHLIDASDDYDSWYECPGCGRKINT